MKFRIRKIVFGFIAIAVVAGAVLLVNHRKNELAEMPRPKIRPEIAGVLTAVRGELAIFEHYLGTIEPVVQAVISPRVTGHLLSTEKDVGDTAAAGEIVARMDDRELTLQKKALAAELEGARSDLEKSKNQFERRKRLYRNKNVTEEALDDAERAYRIALSNVRSLEARIESAAVSTLYAELQAPFEGIVTRRHRNTGDLVMPGQPVYSMEQPAAGYKILVNVPQKTARKISPGSPGVLSLDGQQMEAVVDRVHPAVGPGSLATIEFRQKRLPFGLASGGTVGVDLATGHVSGIRVPSSAILEHEGVAFVFKLDEENRVCKTRVEVKGRYREDAVIDGPVSDGDRLVTGDESMLIRLGDGSRIRPGTRPGKDGQKE